MDLFFPLVLLIALLGAEGAVVAANIRQLRRCYEDDTPLTPITALQLSDVLVYD